MQNVSINLCLMRYFKIRRQRLGLCVLLADGADEAGRVVGLSQSGDHFPLHKVPTAIAAGAVHALVVQRAQILSILHEEAPLGEVTAAHYTGHTHTLAV